MAMPSASPADPCGHSCRRVGQEGHAMTSPLTGDSQSPREGHPYLTLPTAAGSLLGPAPSARIVQLCDAQCRSLRLEAQEQFAVLMIVRISCDCGQDQRQVFGRNRGSHVFPISRFIHRLPPSDRNPSCDDNPKLRRLSYLRTHICCASAHSGGEGQDQRGRLTGDRMGNFASLLTQDFTRAHARRGGVIEDQPSSHLGTVGLSACTRPQFSKRGLPYA